MRVTSEPAIEKRPVLKSAVEPVHSEKVVLNCAKSTNGFVTP